MTRNGASRRLPGDGAARIAWPTGSTALLAADSGWTLDGRPVTVGDLIEAAPQLRSLVLAETEAVVLDALAAARSAPARVAGLVRELCAAYRSALDAPAPADLRGETGGVLRLSVTAAGSGLDDASLVGRMGRIFPGGVEETRDANGGLEVAAYETPPLTLPADVGPWRVEPVSEARTRGWHEPHHGVIIADRLWVGPPDEEPADGLAAVRVHAGHVFGAGGHATTSGCLELLCAVETRGSVLDVGCGSGVLAVAAAVLGHAPVFACDHDPLAVAAARRNCRLNGVAVEPFEADAVTDPLPDAQLWLVNLLEGPLNDVLARPDAPPDVIASGLRHDGRVDAAGYTVRARVERAGWQAVWLRRRPTR